MGMSPEDLAGMTLFEFELKCQGFGRKLKNEESLFRRVAWFSMAPHLGKNSPGIERFWPMEGDSRSNGELFTKKQIEANLAAYRTLREKRLNDIINLN